LVGPGELINTHIDIIQLDINRTPFEGDIEKKRNVLFIFNEINENYFLLNFLSTLINFLGYIQCIKSCSL